MAKAMMQKEAMHAVAAQDGALMTVEQALPSVLDERALRAAGLAAVPERLTKSAAAQRAAAPGKTDENDVPPLGAIIHCMDDWGLEERLAFSDYMRAHELLPERPELTPLEELLPMLVRLHDPRGDEEEQKRVLVLLAHHRTEFACDEIGRFLEACPPSMARFAWLALEEAVQWNLTANLLDKLTRASDRCACGSGRKSRRCCGGGSR